ncbi:hypothetical protein FRB95_012403 [Tulasnella sp. JGI-2019a]|nr:hypothetical protein FRB95_012403 [Tulasnella sp. JGI-2019a]
MPATFIPAPSFIPVVEDADFDADFDLPEGDTVIGPTHTRLAHIDDDDWDTEAPHPSVGSSAVPSRFGTVSNMSLKPPGNKSRAAATTPDPEDWDNDEDFDLPPPTARPLRLSLSPRTKVRMETLAREATAKPSPALNFGASGSEDHPDDEGNASTIKVSRFAFSQALHTTSQVAPMTPLKLVPPPPTSTPADDDFEGDFSIPDTLERLSLKPLPTLTHRLSKASTDPWGDSPSSTLVSDASSSTLSHPSPYHSSQPSTEDDSDGFGDEGDFDGLVLPETLSPIDMQRILEGKKKGLVHGAGDRVKVARPSDGEDDFESGLVIGADDDLSPSRLKKPIFSSRAVGKGTSRSHSAPGQMASHAATQPPPRPPSSLREQFPSSSQPSRGTVRSPTLLVPGTTMQAVRPPQQEPSRPALRRTPSTIVSSSSSSRPGSNGWQTFSNSIRPSPSLILPKHTNLAHRPSSPTKIPLPSPVVQPPRSPVPGPSSSTHSFIKHQKSFSKAPPSSAPPVVRKMTRKASLSSLVDERTVSSQSPSVSPELQFTSSRTTIARKPSMRKGLSHAVSFRDLGGGTLGPSSSPGAGSSAGTQPLRRFAYEAPTAAYSARRATSRSGTTHDDATSGSDREKERRPLMPLGSSSSRSLARARGAISNIFPSPGTSSPTPVTPSAPSPSPLARSPSPNLPHPIVSRLVSLSKQPSTTPTPNVPPRVLRRAKKVRMFGDGTELDGIEDLKVERDKESKYRVVPSGRGNVGTRPKTAGAVLESSSPATISLRNRSGSIAKEPAPLATINARPDSGASGRGSANPSRYPASLRRTSRMEFPRGDSGPATPTTPGINKKNRPSVKRKPVLIRNLSGAGSPKEVNGMKWNPTSLRWEGNDAALRDFDLSSSTRPALITNLTGSPVGGIASPTGAFRSLTNGSRVVGDMMFDPLKMCWVSCTGEEEDPFAEMDGATVAEGDDDDWDADGKGGTIRALVSSLNVGVQKRDSGAIGGMSSSESSPARSLMSRRGSSQHARSASESDSESVASLAGPGSSGAGGGRESSLGSVAAMTMINEDDDNVTFPVARELIAACIAAEERHRGEMRGWEVSSMMRTTVSSRRRLSRGGLVSPTGSPATSRVAWALNEEETNRAYLYDIRALARATS